MKLYGGKKKAEPSSSDGSSSRRTKKMSASTKLLIAIIALILAIAVLVGIYFWLYVQSPSQRPERTTTTPAATTVSTTAKNTTAKKTDSVQTTTATTAATPSQEELEQDVINMGVEIDVSNASYKDGFFTMLVAGTDADGIRTDTIIVATFDTNNKTVAMLNVPRDTLSVSRSGGTHKINSAYNNGVERTKVELKNLLGFEIDRYVILDFDAFEEIIDAVGGVEIDVPVNMYYNDPDQDLHINIKKGLQTLDGKNALHYMRYRGYANADIARIDAQQDFYKAIAKKMATPSTLLKLPALAGVVFDNVTTDLSIGEIIWLGTNYITMDTDTIVTETLPHRATYINGLSYVIPSGSGILKVVNQYFNPYTEDITRLNLAPVPVSTTKATTAAPDDPAGDDPSSDGPSGSGNGVTAGDPIIGGGTDIDENGNVIGSTDPSGDNTSSGGDTSFDPETQTPSTGSDDDISQMPEWLRPQATTTASNTVWVP